MTNSEWIPWWDPRLAPPRVGATRIHVVGSVGSDGIQRCSRCGAPLGFLAPGDDDGGVFDLGSLLTEKVTGLLSGSGFTSVVEETDSTAVVMNAWSLCRPDQSWPKDSFN